MHSQGLLQEPGATGLALLAVVSGFSGHLLQMEAHEAH